ncbi:hypothetical protein Dimus_009636 [Dionaea muscipula]
MRKENLRASADFIQGKYLQLCNMQKPSTTNLPSLDDNRLAGEGGGGDTDGEAGEVGEDGDDEVCRLQSSFHPGNDLSIHRRSI